MEEQKRYLQNAKIAQEIFEIFGFQLNSCNPDWRVYVEKNEGHPIGCIDIPDIFVERLALAMGKKWIRFTNVNSIKQNIERNEKFLDTYKDMVNMETRKDQKAILQQMIQEQEDNLKKTKEAIEFIENIKNTLLIKNKSN